MRALGPLGGEHAVDDEVRVAAREALGAAQDALLAEPEPLRDRAAADVVGRRADLDAVQLPAVEGVLDERADRRGHDPAALMALGQPVADARVAMAPVDAVVADRADDRSPSTITVSKPSLP